MRKLRELIDGYPYHVVIRTNGKEHFFNSRLAKTIIQAALENAKEKFEFVLYNYTIMDNHVHLLLLPKKASDLILIMRWFLVRCSKSYNLIHNRSGHLWGDRYFSRKVDGLSDFLAVFNYIDMNPVSAGLVACVFDWEWGGCFHQINSMKYLVDPLPFWLRFWLPNYRQVYIDCHKNPSDLVEFFH